METVQKSNSALKERVKKLETQLEIRRIIKKVKSEKGKIAKVKDTKTDKLDDSDESDKEPPVKRKRTTPSYNLRPVRSGFDSGLDL